METRRDVVLHLATRAEDLGYESFTVAEGWGHDAGVLLTQIAARTSRIRLGTGVLNVWGRSAASIAMLAADLADVSGGRFTLGLGAGSPALAEGWHDVAFQAPVARLADVTRQVRRLLDGERLVPSVPGAARPLRLAVPPPPGSVPIQLAALGPQAVRLCGELADGWSPFLLPASGLGSRVGLLAEGAARSGRPLPLVCPALPVAVSSDPAKARRLAWWWVRFYLTSMGPLYPRTLRELGFGDAVGAVQQAASEDRDRDRNLDRSADPVPPAARVLIDELTISGDGQAARDLLDGWYDRGANVPAVVLPPQRDLAELEYMLEALQPARVPTPVP
jgi:alkanesulfonate monooxygenase SsuD/methylene tetrahydromethanopterin reductase-like flavin-dependent oxidoreductase (luciferase family)